MTRNQFLIGGGSASLLLFICLCCTVFGLVSPKSTPAAERPTPTATIAFNERPTEPISRLLPAATVEPSATPTPTKPLVPTEPPPTPTATPSRFGTPEGVQPPNSTPQPPTSVAQSLTPSVTTSDNVNLRSGPGTNYDKTGTLQAGQSLNIIGRTADSSWWQVSTATGPAWVNAGVVTAINVTDDIPIVETPTPPTQQSTPTEATATPTPLPAIFPTLPPGNTTAGCCKICGSNSKACGDSCISLSKTCHKGAGCACN